MHSLLEMTAALTHFYIVNTPFFRMYRLLFAFGKLSLIAFTGSTAFSNANFGQGSGSIFLDDVRCTGDELFLVNCTYTPFHNCQHSEDAGVSCQGTVPCLLTLRHAL